MHRHGYKGRKFGRERDQRNALMRGLAISLFEETAITTTTQKAKELRPMAEKLITKAKKGDLAARRAVIATLGNNITVAHRLVDEIAPQIKRDSGYLRIVKLEQNRVGDNAEMARIEFVDELKFDQPAGIVEEKSAEKVEKKPAAKKEAKK